MMPLQIVAPHASMRERRAVETYCRAWFDHRRTLDERTSQNRGWRTQKEEARRVLEGVVDDTHALRFRVGAEAWYLRSRTTYSRRAVTLERVRAAVALLREDVHRIEEAGEKCDAPASLVDVLCVALLEALHQTTYIRKSSVDLSTRKPRKCEIREGSPAVAVPVRRYREAVSHLTRKAPGLEALRLREAAERHEATIVEYIEKRQEQQQGRVTVAHAEQKVVAFGVRRKRKSVRQPLLPAIAEDLRETIHAAGSSFGPWSGTLKDVRLLEWLEEEVETFLVGRANAESAKQCHERVLSVGMRSASDGGGSKIGTSTKTR